MKLKARLARLRVTEQLAEQFRTATPEQKPVMLEALEFYRDQFKRAERDQRIDAGGRALGTHEAMTVWISEAVAKPPAGKAVQCQRGCASCCRLLVSVFPDEAALAVHAAREAGVGVDLERLRWQAQARNVDEWRALSREVRTCVFLHNEQCAIYEHRPASCRKYLVVTPPELCDTDQHPGQEVGMLASAMAEIITSAACTVWGWEPFASALLRTLDEPTP